MPIGWELNSVPTMIAGNGGVGLLRSMTTTAPAVASATYTRLPTTTSPLSTPGLGITFTLRVAASITAIPPLRLITTFVPSDVTATPHGSEPTGTVLTTVLLATSITETLLLSLLAT